MKRVFEQDLALVVPLAIGVMLRLISAVTFDFPINDGGMFYSMTGQLVANGFRLPELMTYNNLQLPFAYPPLGFYLMGILARVTAVDLLVLFRWVPAILACVTLPVFYVFVKQLVRDRAKANLSLLVYSTLYSGYYSLVAGGGLTRSLGLIMALLTLYFFVKWGRTGKIKEIILTGIFLGLTGVSHMEMTVFVVAGMVVLTGFERFKRKGILQAGIIGAVVSSGWWMTILSRFGIEPFIAAWTSNLVAQDGWQQLAFLSFTREGGLTLWAVVGMAGCLWLLWKQKYFLPVWLVVLFVVLRRGAETTVSVPWALISGEVLAIGLAMTMDKRRSVVAGCAAAVWMVFYLVGLFQPNEVTRSAVMESVSKPDRAAMEWVKSNTSPGQKFLVISGTPPGAWSSDAAAEWFPVLSQRESLLTVQGSEWLKGKPQEIYQRRAAIYECLKQNVECVDQLAEADLGWNYDYLYLTNQENCPGSNCPDMGVYAYYSPKKFTNVYQRDGVSVWKKTW